MSVPEARFCRLCGAPLKTSGIHESDAPISPRAQTIPLTGEGRATDGLAADDPLHSAPDTSKVGRAEMENILRRVQADYVGESRKAQQHSSEKAAPQTTMLSPELTSSEESAHSSSVAGERTATSPVQVVQPAANASARRKWQVAAIVLLCVALGATVLAFILSRRASSTDAGSAPPISISDQQQLVSEKLMEAEGLLNSGEFNHAVEVLRAAVKLDPSNAEAHMRLGKALEKTGARAEAVAEYRATTQSNPNNTAAWKALASAQFEEKLYGDAADSYRHLLSASGNNLDDPTWLAYADALRLAGRTEEARAAYQKISSSGSATLAQTARQHLAELGPPTPAAAVNAEHTRDARAEQEEQREQASAATPQQSPTPLARPTPAVVNSSQFIDSDSYYFKGLNLVNGRDPKKLTDGELTAALNYFLRVQGGSHITEAKRNADKLGKEYDRRRKR
jgi:tetratricopeptide (TPR) repeat protein